MRFILRFEREPYFYFSSLQSEFVRERFPELLNKGVPESVVLLEQGTIYKESDAALRIARKLKSPFRFASYFRFVPRFIRDAVYRIIARNRYRFFGRRDALFCPLNEHEARFIN